MKLKSLGINSILIAVATTLMFTMLHELGHYFTAQYFELKPVLHHNFVMPTLRGTDAQNAMVAAAGPLLSLLLGIIILIISTKIKASLLKLFMTWLGMGNILECVGYFLLAPIAKNGDTGKVFAYLGVPLFLSIIIAIAAMMLATLVFRRCVSQFVFYKSEATFVKSDVQRQLFLYPIFGSIIIVTFLNLPMITWVSLLPTIFMPMTYFSTWGAYKKLKNIEPVLVVDKVSLIIVIVCIATISIFRYLV